MSSLIALLLKRIREAGAPDESSTDRDGFLSHKNETHAVAYGLSLGYIFAGPHVELKVLAIAAVGCLECSRRLLHKKTAREIRDQPHYFVFALFVGAIVAYFLHGETIVRTVIA